MGALGRRLLEPVYRRGTMYELGLDNILVENKTVDSIHPVHRTQLLSCPKLSGCSLGFRLSWKITRIKHGKERIIG